MKKFTKKAISILLCATTASAMLIGCQKDSGSKSEGGGKDRISGCLDAAFE